MVSVLFVDDDINVIESLGRGLREIRPKWRLHVACGAAEAITVLKNAAVDVIVTDISMPGTNGAQLLKEVREKYPRTIRILFSSFADTKEVMKSVGEAHQYLTKPVKPSVLAQAIEKTTALDTLLENGRLRSAVTHLKTIPSLPHVYSELISEINKPESSIRRVGEIVASDIGMTAKILQISNSAFFGFRKQVTSPAEAVRFLGLDTVTSLTLAIGVFKQFQSGKVNAGYISEIWNHSTKVAQVSKDIALLEEPSAAEDAFTAGLLHDIGEVVMAGNAPREFAMTRGFDAYESRLRMDAERELFGATHSEIGAYLLNLWGIPSPVVEAVAFHHSPSKGSSVGFNAVSAVHCADALVYVPEFDSDYRLGELCDLDYLDRLGVTGNIDLWLSTCVNADLETV